MHKSRESTVVDDRGVPGRPNGGDGWMVRCVRWTVYFNFLFAMDGGWRSYVNGIERFRLLVAAASISSSPSCPFLWLPPLINPQRRLMLRDFMDRQRQRHRASSCELWISRRASVNSPKPTNDFQSTAPKTRWDAQTDLYGILWLRRVCKDGLIKIRLFVSFVLQKRLRSGGGGGGCVKGILERSLRKT